MTSCIPTATEDKWEGLIKESLSSALRSQGFRASASHPVRCARSRPTASASVATVLGTLSSSRATAVFDSKGDIEGQPQLLRVVCALRRVELHLVVERSAERARAEGALQGNRTTTFSLLREYSNRGFAEDALVAQAGA